MTREIPLGSDADLIKKHWKVCAGEVVFDVGFGPGHWTLAALQAGAFVYAFDPSPDAFAAIMRELQFHQFSRLCLSPAALWNRNGTATLVQGHQVVDRECTEADRLIGVCTLDDFLFYGEISAIDWINMDCEGAELKVIEGGYKSIKTYAPDMIIEVHQGVSVDDLKSLLTEIEPSYEFKQVNGFLIAEAY